MAEEKEERDKPDPPLSRPRRWWNHVFWLDQPPPMSSKKSNKRRSSLISGLVGAVVGSAITAGATVWQAQESFKQAQEKEAYSAFDGAIDEFRAAVLADMRRPESPVPLAPPMKEDIGTSVNDLLLAESKMKFYGTVEAIQSAGRVMQQVSVVQGPLKLFISKHPKFPVLSDAELREFRPAVNEVLALIYGKLDEAQANFRDLAREQLDLETLPRDSLPKTVNPLPALPMLETGEPIPVVGTSGR